MSLNQWAICFLSVLFTLAFTTLPPSLSKSTFTFVYLRLHVCAWQLLCPGLWSFLRFLVHPVGKRRRDLGQTEQLAPKGSSQHSPCMDWCATVEKNEGKSVRVDVKVKCDVDMNSTDSQAMYRMRSYLLFKALYLLYCNYMRMGMGIYVYVYKHAHKRIFCELKNIYGK